MNIIRYLRFLLSLFWFRVFYKHKFLFFGKRVVIDCPLKIQGVSSISLGNRVTLNYRTWIEAAVQNNNEKCELSIGEHTTIGNFNHIFAINKISIGKNVLTADKVYISDNSHSYDDVNMPIKDQPVKFIGEVIIGDNSWIGENVCIMGVKIGRNCVIGANSVVTKDIPDYCIAVGIPAKVIKKFDFLTGAWIGV